MNAAQQAEDVDVVVVGAGVAGMYAMYRMRTDGLTVRGFEAGPDVGGTWQFNRYPGARCDVESVDYSYSFSDELQQEWDWTERYATQPEILRYLEHVAERFDLRSDFDFDTRVTAMDFGEDAARWTVRTDTGVQVTARHVVMATGSLSEINLPGIPGLADFAGRVLHTGAWPRDGVDLTGKRVGVIGTGSSGIQSIPVIAREAAHLTVFQRTPNFSVPANNHPIDEATRAEHKAGYPERRYKSFRSGGGSPFLPNPKSALEVSAAEREAEFEHYWSRGGVLFGKTFADQMSDIRANDLAREFAEAKIRAVVDDPATAEKLIPTDHPIGTKRIVTDSGYFQTYNRDNVDLVDLRERPIDRVEAGGIRVSGELIELDVLVFATGFDAITGAAERIDIRGRGGALLRDEWSGGPRAHLGLMVDGFPNMYLVSGPFGPGVLANMILGSELHVNWIADLIADLDARGQATIEPTAQAVEDWLAHCAELGAKTLFPRANSWYMGANIAGKPRLFMLYAGGFGRYREVLDEVAADGYPGFHLAPAPQEAAAR